MSSEEQTNCSDKMSLDEQTNCTNRMSAGEQTNNSSGSGDQPEAEPSPPEDSGPTYLFASIPSTPKDKPADILVKFKAVSTESPAVDAKAVYLSSRCTLLEARRILHKFFSATYDRGFIFLHHGKEVLRHKERILRLIDVMPRLPLGLPSDFFKFPDVQYKKLGLDKDGRRVLVYFAGVVFLCEKSTQERWQGQQLRKELSAERIEGFSFLPANIMSANEKILAANVDQLCELAAVGSARQLALKLEKLPAEATPETFRDRSLATPLHYASSNGHISAAEIIVGRLGSETLYLRDAYGKTPLHNALYSGHMDVVGYLLQLGPDLQCKDVFGYSCSRLITSLSDSSTKLLLARIEASVLESSLVLHFLNVAFQIKDKEACKLLCQHVHPVQAPFYRPPLHQAAELGDTEIVALLLQQRTSPRIVYDKEYCDNISIFSEDIYRRNSPGRNFRTTQSAIEAEKTETYETMESLAKKKKYECPEPDVISDLDILLDDISDTYHRPDIYDTDGHLPFHYACQHGHSDVIDYLYYSGMKNDDFVKGLKLALYWNKCPTVHLLVNLRPEFHVDKALLGTVVKEVDKDLSKKGKYLLPVLKQCPLLLSRYVPQAAALDDTNALAQLLNLKVAMAGEDFMGRSPLHEACQHGKEAAMRFLLLHGADPNCTDWRGSTPLHYACAAGHLELVTVLAARKEVNLTALDCTLTTPVLLAAQSRQHDVLLYLVAEHAGDIDLLRYNANGDCVLNYLADLNEDLFKIVLEAGVKQKDVPLTKPHPSLMRSRTRDIDSALLEAWADPSLTPFSMEDARAELQKSRGRTAFRIKCLKCQKSFTTLNGSYSWSHLCISDMTMPQVNSPKKSKITAPVKNCADADSTSPGHFRRSTLRLPFHNEALVKPTLSPLDVIILKRKHDLVPLVAEAFPELARREKTAHLAARLLDVDTLKQLHSAETFAKETFTNLLHITLLQQPQDKRRIKEQLNTVNFLLKMGASPNYIPRQDAFNREHFSPLELKLIFFMPLEIAAITENVKLVDLLLEFGATSSISFAVHLAAVLGNLDILQKLLPHWKGGRWKPYIKGLKDDANELIRVCTLESGLVQAVCASHKCSSELLTCVKDDEKGVFNCRKVLTHHMVSQIRPEICSMTSPTLMNRILYKHAEDVKGGEEICQHLYTTNLLLCKEKHLRSQDVDKFVSYLVDNGCYLGEIRVSKKSNIHVVCESFVVAVKRRMWQTVESLLATSGNTLWKCLVCSHHSCHKYAYAAWSDGGQPCLSKGMWSVFHSMPMYLLKLFFDIGKKVMDRHDLKAIKAKINITEDLNVDKTKKSPTTPRPDNLMRDVVLYHVRSLPFSYRGKLIILSKLTMLFPDIFTITLETLRFSSQRHNWFTAAGVDPALKALFPKQSTSKIIQQIRQERVELRLWTTIVNMPMKDVSAVQERDLTVLHIACILNDLRLAHACLSMVVPIHANCADNTGMTPMDIAACRGNIKMLETLKLHGGEAGPSALVAACAGKSFLNGLLSAAPNKRTSTRPRSAQAQGQMWLHQANTLQWLFTNTRQKLNLAYRHPVHGTMFDVLLVSHNWSLLQWTLENAGSETCALVLAMSPQLDRLAYAPEQLLRKISHKHTAILQMMPASVLPKFLLKLSAFPKTHITEHMLKKAVSLKVVENQDKVIKMLAYKGSHGETLLHNACRSGNASLVKCVVTTAAAGDVTMKEVKSILDSPDSSGCTPLWYSLSFRFWKISEFLIVNGARNLPKRAIPGLWNKRMFQEMSRRMSISQQPSNRALLADTQIKRGNSSNVADIISPGSVIFRDLYLESTADVNDDNDRGVPKLEKIKLLAGRKSPGPVRSGRAKTPMAIVQAQDDMESMGRIPSPRTPRSSRTKLPSQLEDDNYSMSPRKHYPEDDDNLEVAKENIHKKKRVRYLLSLVRFTAVNKGTLLHAASSFGNILLLKGIISSPFMSAQQDEKRTYSPFIYALSNNCPAAVQFCMQNKLGPHEMDPFTDVLCFVIMNRSGFEANHKTLKKLLNRFTIAKETIRGIKVSLLPRTEGMKKLWQRGTLLTSGKDGFSDENITQMIQMAIKHDKGNVSSRLLMTLAVTGQLMILTAILGAVEDPSLLTEIFKRKVVHNATVVDLLFLLAPSRLTSEQHGTEYLERMNIINAVSDYVRLEIAPRTLSAAIKKNLIPMLEMIVKDFTRNNLPLQSPELWYEAIFKATIKGELSFINTVCVAEMNTKTQLMQSAMLKALCLACIKRHRAIANRLLLFRMPLAAHMPGLPGRYPGEPKLALECAIEGGDSVIACLILQTMEETGMFPPGEDVMSCIALAFIKGMEPIVDHLLRFAHVVSPSLVTLKICHKLFLTAARRGAGMVCAKFLSLPDFNACAMDDYGFTALHYACMYGKSKLVLNLLEVASASLQMRTPEGWTPLDLARGFGHFELSLDLISHHRAIQGCGFGGMATHSWLKRFLTQNSELNSDTSILMSPASPKSRGMDIVTLLKQGNDNAVKNMLEVAQESVVFCLLFWYEEYPLLHLCSQTGCAASLDMIMKLISAQPKQVLESYLQKEIKGKIPICVAIENCNVECTAMLLDAFDPSSWRYKPTGECILHIAAKTNNADIIELMTRDADHAYLQTQDKDGLIPATTSIALGHHETVNYFLRGLQFAEKLHHDHTTTTYWCVLCLLDCCIGWSKIYLKSVEVSLNGKGRNIFQRHRTESGFCVYSHIGNKAHTHHVLYNINRWILCGASIDVRTAALSTMQYSTNGFKSELFLLLSRMTRFEAMSFLIKRGYTEIACYVYEKLCPSLDMASKMLHFINASAYGREMLVTKILELSGDDMTRINYEGEYSALDVAVAFGHKHLLKIASRAFETSMKLNSLKFLEKTPTLVPLDIRWSLGMSRIGDTEWRKSIDYQRTRLSHIDIFLLKRSSINSLPADLLPRDIMPLKLRGRIVEVNHRSMQAAILELGIDDTYLTSLLVSKAVLGRYYSDLDDKCEDWKTVKKIILHCVTPSSPEGAKTELQWKDLHDTILVQKGKDGQGKPTVEICTAEFPEQITPFHGMRNSITEKVLPAVKRQIEKQLYGLDIEVCIDWNTIDSPHDQTIRKNLIDALVGTSSVGPLAGLSAVLDMCSQTLNDIELLYNEDTVKDIVKMLEAVREIQVKYIRALPKAKDVISIPHDGRMVWYFMLDNGRPRYNTSLFGLSILIQMFHSVAVSVHSSILSLTQRKSFRGGKKSKVIVSPKVRSELGKGNITFLVLWKSFMFLNGLKALMHFVETAVVPQLLLLAAQYKGMMRLELDINTVLLRSVTSEEEAGVTFTDGVLAIALHSYSVTHKPWTVSELDSSKVFNELEVSRLSRKWRTASVNVTGGRHRAINALMDHIGYSVELPMVGRNVLEMLCRLEARQMVHPYELLKMFGLALYSNIARGYIDSAITKLSFSSDSFFVGRCNAPPGLYGWIRQFEAQSNTGAQQFLMYCSSKRKKTRSFNLVTKAQLQKQPRHHIAGLWQRIPTNTCHETIRHPHFVRGQLIVMNKKVFLITSATYLAKFLSSLPEAVSVGFPDAHPRTKCISFDQALCRQLDLSDISADRRPTKAPSTGVSQTMEYYDFLSWQLAARKGFNVVFETHNVRGNKTTPVDTEAASGIGGLPKHVQISLATYRTLCDVTDDTLYEKQDRVVIKSLFSNIGTISIGPSIPDKCIELIHGEEFDENADVYLVSDRDIHILPMGPLWSGDTAGEAYPQALLVALCNMFLQQTKSRVSNVLAQNLSRNIDPSDIKFKERVTSADQVSSLSATHGSVKALEGAIRRILSQSMAGKRKLKMDLTGVEFSEHKTGPLVSFQAGVLKCPLFSKGTKVNQKAMDRAFLFAVDEEGGRNMMMDREHYDNDDLNNDQPFADDLFSVRSSEVRALSKGESILEKQRIVKHQSDDIHVIQLAVKRLFSGVEIGRTSDIMDSLDIGANVNSANDHGETPLIVAAKSRNYTIIDLLLTRGAAPNTADALGVTPLHYESGQGDVEAVKLMLSYGANANAQDSFGRTPLHYAVVGCHPETVDLLVFCGADSNIVNKDGESAKSLAQTKAIRTRLHEADLIIRGIKSRNVAIEHLILQADTVYKLNDTGLTIRTPSGMGLSKTSLMVRRVVPEYSFFGPQPTNQELLLSDIYDFRISGAYVEEPLLLQIPLYSRAEQHEDIFVKTDKKVYTTPLRVARVVNADKVPQLICHARICLYGVKSIILVTRARAERLKVTPSGMDFRSVIDPMIQIQFRQNTVQEECDVTLQVTSKPSYEEEEYDSILSMSHFFELGSSDNKPLQNDVLVTLPLPENYLGHGILHVLVSEQSDNAGSEAEKPWVELLRNPDYARDVVKLRISSWCQICLLERNPQYLGTSSEGPSGDAVRMVTSLFNKTQRREYTACFLAMARPKHGAKHQTEAEVVVECVISSKIHSRLQHWRTEGFVDMKPSHTMEFATVPKQAFVIKAAGCCADTGVIMPPLQFHPKRNNCVRFSVQKVDTKGADNGFIQIMIRTSTEVSKSGRATHLSRSYESLCTDGSKSRHHDELLSRIPLFLSWTAPPDDPRGQDNAEKANASPFDTKLIKMDIRGTDSPSPVQPQSPPVIVKAGKLSPVESHAQQLSSARSVSSVDRITSPMPGSTRSAKSGLLLKPGKAEPPESPKKYEPQEDIPRKLESPKRMDPPRKHSARGRSSRIAVAPGTSIRVVTPSAKSVKNNSDAQDSSGTPSPSQSPSPRTQGGVLDWLARDLGTEWFRMGVLLGVPYASLQTWMDDVNLSNRQRAEKMLYHWKGTRCTRQDHGVPELLLTLQRLGRTELVRSLKDKLRAWIADNLERRGCLRGVVNKNLLEDTENLEPMSPLHLLSLVRKTGFSLDFIYELGLSRPEVSRIMTDPFLKHREDKMLGLLLIYRDKEDSYASALEKILKVLTSYEHTLAVDWILTSCRQWLVNQGCADDPFAHAAGDILQKFYVQTIPDRAPETSRDET